MKPMLAVSGSKKDISTLQQKGYIFELKLDGIRAVCYKKSDGIKLINRNGIDITHRFPELNIKDNVLCSDCILDGELVVFDDSGKPNFALALKRQTSDPGRIKERSKEFPASYVVFDLIEKDGIDLSRAPLIERKKMLDELIAPDSFSVQNNIYTTDGLTLWNEIKKRKLEGIVAKKKDSFYTEKRSYDWIKIKNFRSADCIIVGFTVGIRYISSLALAVWEKDNLLYIGNVGTGFSESILQDLKNRFADLALDYAPENLKDKPRIRINWLKPVLVCEVYYIEFTKDKKLRAPSFKGIREDKDPKECNIVQLM